MWGWGGMGWGVVGCRDTGENFIKLKKTAFSSVPDTHRVEKTASPLQCPKPIDNCETHSKDCSKCTKCKPNCEPYNGGCRPKPEVGGWVGDGQFLLG